MTKRKVDAGADTQSLALSEAIHGAQALKRDLDGLVGYLPVDGMPAAIVRETHSFLTEALAGWQFCAPELTGR